MGPVLLGRVLNALQEYIGGGVIRVYHLRAIRADRFQHVEADLVVPESWSVERAHDLSEDVAARVMRDLGVEGEMVFHTDPVTPSTAPYATSKIAASGASPSAARRR